MFSGHTDGGSLAFLDPGAFTVLSPGFMAWAVAVAARYMNLLAKHGVAPSRALIKLSDEPYPSDPCSISALRTVSAFLRAEELTREIQVTKRSFCAIYT